MRPDPWQLDRLGDLCERITDGSHSSPKPVEDGPPIVTVANMRASGIDLTNCVRISPGDFAALEQYGCRPKAGDVLFSKDGSVGKVLVMRNGPEFVVLSSIAILTPRQDRLSSDFLAHSLKWSRNLRVLQGMKTGTAIKRVVLRDLRRLRLAIPPLFEQRKIAAILGSMDDAIEKTRAVLDQVQVLKRGLMQTLLTTGLPGQHRHFTKSSVGRLPETWKVVRLGDIATVKGGKRMPKGRSFAPSRTPYPYLRVVDFKDGSIDTSELRYVLPEDRELIKRYTISKDDVYISIAGTLGLVGSIPPELDGAQLTENAAKIVLDRTDRTDRDFVRLALASQKCQIQLARLKGVGGGVPKLALFRIEQVSLPLPTREEQRAIVSIFDSIRDYESWTKEQSAAITKIKFALTSVLLSGELRVTPDPERE